MNIKRKLTRAVIVGMLMLAVLVMPVSAKGKPPSAGNGPGNNGGAISCKQPRSNADALDILSNYYPGYWWDHTDLTIAIQAAPNVDAKYLKAINKAITTWTNVLNDCFDGAITLTNVTGSHPSKQKADIVLHYVPNAGGAS